MKVFLQRERGAAFVELALAIPILVLLLAGVGDFARIFYHSIELSNAARAGAQYGAVSLGNSANTAAIKSTAAGASTNIGLAAGNISTSLLCVCSNADGSTISSSVSCSAPVSSVCASGQHRILSVSVTATKTFNMVMRIPPLPSSMSISRTAIERVSE